MCLFLLIKLEFKLVFQVGPNWFDCLKKVRLDNGLEIVLFLFKKQPICLSLFEQLFSYNI